MKTITYLLCLPMFVFSVLKAQQPIDFKQLQKPGTKLSAKASELFTVSNPVRYSPRAKKEKDWDVSYQHLGFKHGNELLKSKRDSVKYIKNLRKLHPKSNPTPQKAAHESDDILSLEKAAIDPILALDFKGNDHNGWVPPDNNIAISDAGYIVSVVNSSIFASDDTGNGISQTSFSNFFSVLNLDGAYFDPKIVYDPTEDKFILVVLSGNTAANSTIVVAFSTSSNPFDDWWFYTISGNPLNDGSWFDFPSIGISAAELFVSGNLFDPQNDFNQVVVYQINKANGFTGGNINWVYWSDVRDSYGARDFTVVPISYGFDGAISPGIFMVSTNSGGGNEVMLYWITETLDNNPELQVNAIAVEPYNLGGDGQQFGTTNFISTNDNRTLSGFYADDVVHFVLNAERSNGFTGLYYGRIDVPSLSASTGTFGLDGFEYTFPSVAPFTTSETDKTVLIGFMRTGASIYPEFRVVTVDNNWDWSASVLVRGGDGFVDFLQENVERWGDYSGIARRHLTNGIEVWVSGCYGEDFDSGFSNVLGTWIGKISGDAVQQQAPSANFTANQTIVTAGTSVAFTDLSTNNPNNWAWTFPGGVPNQSTQTNPTVTYNTPGTYDVSLVAANVAGNDTETKVAYITVNADVQAPFANFSANQTVVDEGTNITFTDLSTNNPSNWVWSFPGGMPATSTLSNPTIQYNTAGTYDVTLIASNAAGNDTETKVGYITVSAGAVAPQANFMADQTAVNEGTTISFTDLSSNTPTNWVWSFPGASPSTSTQANPSVTYPNAGTYDVTLVASNTAGNDTETKVGYITVNAGAVAPQANFMADQTAVNEGTTISFTDLSSNTPTNWVWSFPGASPSTSTQANPSVTYPNAGTYDVTLVASNTAGNDTETKVGYITVNAGAVAPQANFMADQTAVNEGTTISFTDLSSNTPTNWVWSFPGASPSTSTQANPSVTYPNAGTYDVTLVASNTAGNDTETKVGYITVNAGAVAPQANFMADQTAVNEGTTISFTDLSSNTPTNWVWSFPGASPSTSTQANPSVTYPNAGTYDVTLVASNTAGNDTETKVGYITVNAGAVAPQANFMADQTAVNEGTTISFTDLSSNTPTNWVWSFPGASPSTSTQANPSVTYPNAGTYDVTLVASNTAGNDTETKVGYITVNAGAVAPQANFMADQTAVNEGTTISFTDLSSNTPTNWVWSFPGASPSTSTQANPSVTYPNAGTYDVTLVASNTAGNDTETKVGYITVNAGAVAPQANFMADQTAVNEGTTISFTDLSSNTPTNWVWSFPGASPSTSTQANPSVTYPNAGTYDVTLVASNTAGNDTETKIGYITVSAGAVVPVADFMADETIILEGESINFMDLSTNVPTNWVWSFPGGSPGTSTIQNPTISYDTPGVYDVSLVASNSAGNGTSTKTDYITVDLANPVYEDFSKISNLVIFPNPSASGERISAQFGLAEAMELDFYIVDDLGRVLKHLLHHRAKAGENLIGFNGEMLSAGTYYLIIQSSNKQLLRSGKIIIF